MSGKVERCADNSYTLQALTCDICHKYFNGKKPYEEHLQSNNHKKKLKEKALLNVASQENFNPHVKSVQSDGGYKSFAHKKNVVDDSQFKKVLSDLEKTKALSVAEWKPAENNNSSAVLLPKSNDRDCKQFYVECAVCQLYFTSQKSAAMHFNSEDHKQKEAHHREIEELYNCIKNVDIQDVVENLLCDTPSISLSGKNMESNNVTDTTVISRKSGILEADGLKLPIADRRTKEKQVSDFRTKEKSLPDSRTKEKMLPGCNLCGITSFATIVSSLNHLTTPEHCRRSAMQAEATRLNCKISKELSSSSSISPSECSPIMPSIKYEEIAIPSHIALHPEHHYYKEEQRKSCKGSLNPIGYERKQKHKQYQQSNIYTHEQPICLPDNYNFDCNGKTGNTTQCLSEVPQNPFTIEFKYERLISSDFSLAVPLPQKAASKPFPRLAANFPQSDLNTQ